MILDQKTLIKRARLNGKPSQKQSMGPLDLLLRWLYPSHKPPMKKCQQLQPWGFPPWSVQPLCRQVSGKPAPILRKDDSLICLQLALYCSCTFPICPTKNATLEKNQLPASIVPVVSRLSPIHTCLRGKGLLCLPTRLEISQQLQLLFSNYRPLKGAGPWTTKNMLGASSIPSGGCSCPLNLDRLATQKSLLVRVRRGPISQHHLAMLNYWRMSQPPKQDGPTEESRGFVRPQLLSHTELSLFPEMMAQILRWADPQ